MAKKDHSITVLVTGVQLAEQGPAAPAPVMTPEDAAKDKEDPGQPAFLITKIVSGTGDFANVQKDFPLQIPFGLIKSKREFGMFDRVKISFDVENGLASEG